VNRALLRSFVRGAAAVLVGLAPVAAVAAGLCAGPPSGLPIVAPLPHFAARVNEGGPLNIVAVGSSSTWGTGASSPDFSYPSRLAVALRQHFPKIDIHVENRGKGGEDAPEELARLPADVVALHPDLAIWQVGTNAVLRRDDLGTDGEWMREGVELLKRGGIDVVLMDLQVAPRVLDRPGYATMEELIADTAVEQHVGLFRRFALMRYWQSSHSPDAPPMIGTDGLHMTDAGYSCLAEDLAAALEANWRAEAKLALRARAIADTVAGLPARTAATPANGVPRDPMRRNDATPFN
jgi:acyl-CoA thioesterase I